ncbi:MAG: suppressor of fused domain protein [Methanomassiliicoccaceae archaeon]|nr:suppressor of fused domain protein [Methanomassiliicoccaceae archaeon]
MAKKKNGGKPSQNKAGKGKGSPDAYGDDEAAAVRDHIGNRFGKYRTAFGETFPNGARVDIAIIDPTPERNFYTLITIGAGAHRMDVPPEMADADLDRAEFMICLPPDWDVDSEEEMWHWPIQWLKISARLSFEPEIWLWWGQTMPLWGAAPDDVAFSHTVLIPPALFDEDAILCRLPDGKGINFLQILPIYDDEMYYLEENGFEAFLELWESAESDEDLGVIDIGRESICGGPGSIDDMTPFTTRVKMFWGWFSENEEALSKVNDGRSLYEADDITSSLAEGAGLISGDLVCGIVGKNEMAFKVKGNECLFYLLPYLVSKMPERYKGKWKVHPYTPGTGGEPYVLEAAGRKVSSDEIMISLEDDCEGEGTAVCFHDKEFAALDEDVKYPILYSIMCEITGDLLPHICVTDIRCPDAPADDMFPLTELEKRLEEIAKEKGVLEEPSESFVQYELDPTGLPELRSDISKGITCYPELIYDYRNEDHTAYFNSVKCGAVPAFVFFMTKEEDRDILLEECEAVAKALEENALGGKGSGDEIGIILGYAVGDMCGYIDMMLFDEWEFIEERAMDALKPLGHVFCIGNFEPGRGTIYLGTGDGADLRSELLLLQDYDEYGVIIEAIEESVPADERGLELTVIYAASLTSLGHIEEAVRLLRETEDEGKDDIPWNITIGTSLLLSGAADEAVEHFQKCIDLGHNDEDMKMMLELSRTLSEPAAGKKDAKKKK